MMVCAENERRGFIRGWAEISPGGQVLIIVSPLIIRGEFFARSALDEARWVPEHLVEDALGLDVVGRILEQSTTLT